MELPDYLATAAWRQLQAKALIRLKEINKLDGPYFNEDGQINPSLVFTENEMAKYMAEIEAELIKEN